MRCGGARLQPDCRRPRRSLKNLLQEAGIPPWQRDGLPLLFCEHPGQASLATLPRPARVLALTGPEGGWDDAEIEAARAAGFTTVGLGPRILRAETAAVAALTALQVLWGDLG